MFTNESEGYAERESLMIPLPSCRFTLDQNFLPIPTQLATPLPSLPSLPSIPSLV